MANPKVSIVVPIFNVEEYLEMALQSAADQTLKDIEIICVNDGSTDSSLKILQKFAESDNRIKIIDKPNEGYGRSMNRGIDEAKGEFIAILEPDDYFRIDMLDQLYSAASKNKLDFAKADFYRFFGDPEFKMELEYVHTDPSNSIYGKLLNPSDHPELLLTVINTWTGIYRKSFLDKFKIRHHETPGAAFQDNGFGIQTLAFASRAMFITKPLYYNRRDNPNSSIRNPGIVYAANEEYAWIKQILQSHKGVWEKFGKFVTLKKYDNYVFTLTRVAPKFIKKYVTDIANELREDKTSGDLNVALFRKHNRGDIELLLAHPDIYYEERGSFREHLNVRIWDLQQSNSFKIGTTLTKPLRALRKK